MSGPDGGVVDDEIVLFDGTTGEVVKGSGGAKLSDFKLLFPTDYDDYAKMRDTFTKEWNGMLGL